MHIAQSEAETVSCLFKRSFSKILLAVSLVGRAAPGVRQMLANML